MMNPWASFYHQPKPPVRDHQEPETVNKVGIEIERDPQLAESDGLQQAQALLTVERERETAQRREAAAAAKTPEAGLPPFIAERTSGWDARDLIAYATSSASRTGTASDRHQRIRRLMHTVMQPGPAELAHDDQRSRTVAEITQQRVQEHHRHIEQTEVDHVRERELEREQNRS